MATSGGGRRGALSSAALVAAVLGAVVDADYQGGSVFDVWTPLLVVSWGAPAVALAAAGTRGGRWVAMGAALVAGLLAVPLVPYGYGLYQLPTVVLLALAARRDR